MQRRLTEAEDSRLRRVWNILGEIADPCEEIGKIRRAMWEMVAQGTTDGKPYVEPELTDDDMAKRIWVMCRDRDTDPWMGPRKSAAKSSKFYYVFNSKGDILADWVHWVQCRRATPAEIAAAGLEVAE